MLESNNLFNFNLLKEMLLLSKKINEDTKDEKVLALYDIWITGQREFRIVASSLNLEQKERFNLYVQNKIDETKESEDKLFIFNSIKFFLKDFMQLNKIEIAKVEKEQLNETHKIFEQSKQFLDNNLEDKRKELTPMTFNDFMNKVDKKVYYVKQMFAAGTINMVFSPPKQMKSFISYYLALCIAQGKPFLNQKTKKVPVCYFDWENPIGDVQNRINGICEGMNFDKSQIDNFFLFPKQPTLIKVDKYDSYVYEDLRNQLLGFIKDNNIKVIFFDTFRRLGNFDENDSQTINTIKSELFNPLIKATNICIIFLHHTSKEGKTYRGSVDIEGILDTSFKVTKKDTNDTIKLTMTCDARRNNEVDKLTSNIEIENEEIEDEDGDMYENIISVKFNKTIDEDEEAERDYNGYRNYFINNLKVGMEYRNKELIEMLQYTFSIKSTKTTNEILNWCSYTVSPRVLLKSGKGKTTRYQLNPELQKNVEMINFNDKDNTLNNIEKYMHNLFKDIEQIKLSQLILNDEKGWAGMFKEKNVVLIIDKWNKKGWLNTAKKDYLTITDLYRDENK